MFGILDVAIILLVLLCIFIGAWRGLIGSLAKMLGGFLKLIISILLTKPVVSVLYKTRLDEHLFSKLTVKFGGVSQKFNVNLVGMPEDELNTFVGDALSDAKIPKLFRGFFKNIFSITPETISAKESVTIAEMMGVTVGNIIMLVGTFVVLCLLLWIISKIALRWSKSKAKSNTLFGKTNKWLGGVFGLLKSAVIIFVVFIVVSALSNFSFMTNIVGYVNNSFIGGPLYRLSAKLLETSFDFKGLLENWLTNSK